MNQQSPEEHKINTREISGFDHFFVSRQSLLRNYKEALVQNTLPPRSKGHFTATRPPQRASHFPNQPEFLSHRPHCTLTTPELQRSSFTFSRCQMFSWNIFFFKNKSQRDLCSGISNKAAPRWLWLFWGKVKGEQRCSTTAVEIRCRSSGKLRNGQMKKGKLRLLSKSWQRAKSWRWTKREKWGDGRASVPTPLCRMMKKFRRTQEDSGREHWEEHQISVFGRWSS